MLLDGLFLSSIWETTGYRLILNVLNFDTNGIRHLTILIQAHSYVGRNCRGFVFSFLCARTKPLSQRRQTPFALTITEFVT